MRCSVFCGASVDGFIARKDDTLDFFDGGGEPHGFDEFYATVDVIVMGRKTFDVVTGFDEWPYRDKRVDVLSENEIDRSKLGRAPT